MVLSRSIYVHKIWLSCLMTLHITRLRIYRHAKLVFVVLFLLKGFFISYSVTFRFYSTWELLSRLIYFFRTPYKSFITVWKFLCYILNLLAGSFLLIELNDFILHDPFTLGIFIFKFLLTKLFRRFFLSVFACQNNWLFSFL